jgi:hypothetical protein
VNDDVDPLLDRFMPAYEVVERHGVRVRASAEITLAAAREQDLLASPVIRAISKPGQCCSAAGPTSGRGRAR